MAAYSDTASSCLEQPDLTDGERSALLNNRAVADLYLGRIDAAIDGHQGAIRLTPDAAALYRGLGRSLRANGQLDAAIEAFDRAAALEPDTADNLIERGQTRYCAGAFAAAAEDFDAVLRQEPEADIAMIWSFLAKRFAGQSARAELERRAGALDMQAWPDVLYAIFLDRYPADGLPLQPDDDPTIPERLAIAQIYYLVAQYERLNDRIGAAVPLLELSALTEAYSSAAHACARREVADLAAAPVGGTMDRSSPHAIAHGNAVLWRIEGANATPSHLFGTIHVTDPAVLDLPPPVATAFDGSSILAVESLGSEADIAGLIGLMRYPEGRSLDDVLGPEAVDELARSLDLPRVEISTLKPWGLLARIESAMVWREGTVLDGWMVERFQDAGRPVLGLESAVEQYAAYDGLPEIHQVAFLIARLRAIGAVDGEEDAMLRYDIDTYLARDIGKLYAESILGDYARADGVMRRFLRTLIYERNTRFVERMRPLLRGGGAFVAVGAAHLPGAAGMVALLRRDGYTVTPVY